MHQAKPQDSAIFASYKKQQPELYRWVSFITEPAIEGFGRRIKRNRPAEILAIGRVGALEIVKFLNALAYEVRGNFLEMDLEQLLAAAPVLRQQTKPTIVLLRPGLWTYDIYHGSVFEIEQKQLIEVARSTNYSMHPIVLVTDLSALEMLPPLIRASGVINQIIYWTPSPPADLVKVFYATILKAHSSEALLQGESDLEKIFQQTHQSCHSVQTLAQHLNRMAVFGNRKIDLIDLFNILNNGLTEAAQTARTQTSEQYFVREAGHILIEYLQNDIAASGSLEEICYKLPCRLTSSKQIWCIQKSYEDQQTAETLKSNIQYCLAGRAAEDIVYGVELSSFRLPSLDLEVASQLCLQLVTQRPHTSEHGPPRLFTNLNYDVLQKSAGLTRNLSVLREGTQRELARLYSETWKILHSRRQLLDVIRRALCRYSAVQAG